MANKELQTQQKIVKDINNELRIQERLLGTLEAGSRKQANTQKEILGLQKQLSTEKEKERKLLTEQTPLYKQIESSRY